MPKKLVIEIAEGLGNQLFKYAFAHALAKKNNYNLLIDDTSGYSRKKNSLRDHQIYMLNLFNIDQNIAPSYYKYDNFYKRLKRKIEIFYESLSNKKKFIYENKKKINGKKIASFLDIPGNINLSNILYISGYFEDENYFKSFKNDLKKIYKPLPQYVNNDLKIIDKLKNSNSISIHVRQHRYSEQSHEKKDHFKLKESEKFLNDLISYIYKSVDYFEKNLPNPKFFIWSNDFINLDTYFNKNKFTFINGNNVINDFNLFSYSKHFIVGASTFHWWGAWLNENPNKICVYPSNLNPSGNKNFWPKEWIPI